MRAEQPPGRRAPPGPSLASEDPPPLPFPTERGLAARREVSLEMKAPGEADAAEEGICEDKALRWSFPAKQAQSHLQQHRQGDKCHIWEESRVIHGLSSGQEVSSLL